MDKFKFVVVRRVSGVAFPPKMSTLLERIEPQPDGHDALRASIEGRKAVLAKLPRRQRDSIVFNQY